MDSGVMTRAFMVLLGFLLTAGPALACAGCREPGEDVESATVMAGLAFSWAVLFMLAVVCSLVGGVGAYVWKTIKAVDGAHQGDR
jgi:hypothetical protein